MTGGHSTNRKLHVHVQKAVGKKRARIEAKGGPGEIMQITMGKANESQIEKCLDFAQRIETLL